MTKKEKIRKENKIIIKYLQKKLKGLEYHYDIVLSSVEMRLTTTFDNTDFNENLESLRKIKYLYTKIDTWIERLKEKLK